MLRKSHRVSSLVGAVVGALGRLVRRVRGGVGESTIQGQRGAPRPSPTEYVTSNVQKISTRSDHAQLSGFLDGSKVERGATLPVSTESCRPPPEYVASATQNVSRNRIKLSCDPRGWPALMGMSREIGLWRG